MTSPTMAASRRAATTAAASWISRMPLVPALVPWDPGAGRRHVASPSGAPLSRLYGDPSGPPDHCPNAASLGPGAASRPFATTRPRPVGPAMTPLHIGKGKETERDSTARPDPHAATD